MDTKKNIQNDLLNSIKNLLPVSSNLADELSDILKISMDSAYRRMRGETLLNIEEVFTLCDHFKISFDSFKDALSGKVTFSYTILNNDKENFEKYLKSLVADLGMIKAAPQRQIIYACQDLPVFYHYAYSALGAFKMFYWMRSIMNTPELENEKFSISSVSPHLFELGQEIIQLYRSVPSVEIWTNTTIESTIKQIKFYWDSGLFTSGTEAVEVCEALKQELTNIQKQAEKGSKFSLSPQGSFQDTKANYDLYFSEIELTNNCVLIKIGEHKSVYLGHLSFNTMSTSNTAYCGETDVWLENLIRKSTRLSVICEKQRYQFFKDLFQKIDTLIQKISNESGL